MPTDDKDVLFNSVNNIGVITLNRAKALNAINASMMSKVLPILRQWEKEKTAVILKGNGLLSAGGDVKSIWEKEETGYELPLLVYNMLYLISNYEVPSIAIMDGITMGGGLAMAVFSRYRVATEYTVVAMPEVKIGMIPDAGGSYFLPRLQYRLGYYMGLTGSSLKGKDALRSRLATHYVPKAKLPALEENLLTCKTDEDFKRVLDEFSEQDDELPLATNIRDIEYCFGGESVEEILRRLVAVGNEWSAETVASMRAACPGSLKITLRSLQTGSGLNLWRCLQQDFRLVYWSIRNYDFREGVRAVLFEKDNHPKWKPETLSDVTEAHVNSFFRPLPDNKDLYLLTPTAKL